MLIDSNILVYSLNNQEPKCLKAQQFIQDLDTFVVAHQNIFESIRVLTHKKYIRPMTVNRAIKSIKKIVDNAIIIAPINATSIYAFELIKKYQLIGDKIFDAYLVATMISNNISTIATDNVKDFKIYKMIKIINPFE